MNSIGEALRRERLRRNLDLEQVAKETKISVKLLEAIEAEDFSKLPGGVFAKSFVRQYARLLGLDEDEIVAELQRSIQPPAPALETPEKLDATPPAIELPRVPDWGYTKSRSNSALPALAGVVVVMLICSGVYAWWQRAHRPEAVAPQTNDMTQANPPATAPQPPPVESPQAAPTGQEPAPASAPPASGPGEQPQAAEQQPATQPPATQPPPSGAPAAENAGSVHVMITAQEPTWVSARSDGRVVYSGTLQTNEKKDLAAVDQVRLVVGNAGGINIELNGKPVPPLGPRGQVRVVQFSPGGVQIVPPPKPLAPGAL